MNGNSDPKTRASWTDFCEHHAALAAEEFAWHVGQHLQDNPHYAGLDYGRKFSDYFLHHFNSPSPAPAVLLMPRVAPASSAPSSSSVAVVDGAVNSATFPGSISAAAAADKMLFSASTSGTPAHRTNSHRSSKCRSFASSSTSAAKAADSAPESASGSPSPKRPGDGPSAVPGKSGRAPGKSKSDDLRQRGSASSFFQRFSFGSSRGSGGRPLCRLFKHRSEDSEISGDRSSFEDLPLPPPPLRCCNSTTDKRQQQLCQQQQQHHHHHQQQQQQHSHQKSKHQSGPGSQQQQQQQQQQQPMKMTKMLVECLKEGNLNKLADDDSNGKARWERCRLVLVRTTGGDLLEIYVPPKCSRPRTGVFCFMIHELRETTALEMPECENTFVVKATFDVECVFQAKDPDEMRSWLEAIQRCTDGTGVGALGWGSRSVVENRPSEQRRGSLPSQNAPLASETPEAKLRHSCRGAEDAQSRQEKRRSSNISFEGEMVTLVPPSLPPRTPNRGSSTALQGPSRSPVNDDQAAGRQKSSARTCAAGSSSEQPAATTSATAPSAAVPNETNPSSGVGSVNLSDYPWFHGMLTRMEAAHLVLRGGNEAHGVFLVRQSETRRGEFVLTFNFQARAKHLRMTLSQEGQCRVQHLCFSSIFDMLEHFRSHPIPLETGGSSDVTLADFVVSASCPVGPPAPRPGSSSLNSSPDQNATAASSGSSQQASGAEDAANQDGDFGPGTRPVVTRGGSVRARIDAAHGSSASVAGVNRAVENPYSFV